jgi:hypothetical protein
MGDEISDDDIAAFMKQLEWVDKVFDKLKKIPGGVNTDEETDVTTGGCGGGEGNEYEYSFEEGKGTENDLLATMEKLDVHGDIIKTPTKPPRPNRPPPAGTLSADTASSSPVSTSSSKTATTTTITTTTTTTTTTTSSAAVTNVVGKGGITPSGQVLLRLQAKRNLETGDAGREEKVEKKIQTFISQITTEAAAPAESSSGGDSKEKEAEKKKKRPRSKPVPLPPPINSIKRTRRTTTKSVVACDTTTTTNATTAATTVATAAGAVEEEPFVVDLVTDDEASGDKDEDTNSSSSSSDDDDDGDDEIKYHGVREHKLTLMYDAFVVNSGLSYESSNHKSKRWAAKAADQIRVALYGSAAKPLNFPKNLGKYLKGGISESILECVGEDLCTELKGAIIKEGN